MLQNIISFFAQITTNYITAQIALLPLVGAYLALRRYLSFTHQHTIHILILVFSLLLPLVLSINLAGEVPVSEGSVILPLLEATATTSKRSAD